MKLLIDENLSDKILPLVLDLFPGSSHVKSIGLVHTPDPEIWDVAQSQGFTILTKDSDFHQMSLFRGFPPKVIHLMLGNVSTKILVEILRKNVKEIKEFHDDQKSSLLIIQGY
jgi:predicted nuclease of predicted toxin-antitoxin system